jgi:hypothetical protein
MESNEIWREVMGYTPEERGGLAKMLDDSVRITASFAPTV